MKVLDEIKQLVRSDSSMKIWAIQILRNATGIGLLLAKQIVDTLEAGGDVDLCVPERPGDDDVLARAEATYGRRYGVVSVSRRCVQFADDEVDEFLLAEVFYVHRKKRGTRFSLAILVAGPGKVEFTDLDESAAQALERAVATNIEVRFGEQALLTHWDRLDLVEAKFETGIISREEFDAAKARIVAEMRREAANGTLRKTTS
jgi:hypothetical protein